MCLVAECVMLIKITRVKKKYEEKTHFSHCASSFETNSHSFRMIEMVMLRRVTLRGARPTLQIFLLVIHSSHIVPQLTTHDYFFNNNKKFQL
jgi:hypothetical protein